MNRRDFLRATAAGSFALATGQELGTGYAVEGGARKPNVLFILSDDQRLSLGDHGLMGKQNLYEYGGMHVPFVVGPGACGGYGAGTRGSPGGG